MNWNMIKKFLCLFFVLSFVTACSSNGNDPTGESPTGGQSVTGICANDYYPVIQGATWSYKSTGSPAGDYKFTDTISFVKSEGFTLASDFGELTRTQDWSCTEDGLTALQLAGTSAATLSSQDLNFTLDIKKVEGVTYPIEMNPGDVWQHLLEFEGKMEIAGAPATAVGNAQTAFKVLGSETVTVPAGTFQTVKVQTDTNIVFTIQVQGISVPVSSSGTYSYWYAKGVGWVKAEGQGNITGKSFTETIELQSYNIP
jgi:hypothetical protein